MSKKISSKLKQFLLGAVVGGAFGFVLAFGLTKYVLKPYLDLLIGTSAPLWEHILKVVLSLVALWAALAAHELGHLLTGLAQGFRFHLYVAGFLGVRRNATTDQIEWYLNRDSHLFGGVAATLPTEQSPQLRRQFAYVVMAGPLTSLGGALLLGGPACWILTQATALSTAGRLSLTFALVFALSSFLLFLATTIPNRTGAFFTDRARFFRLIGGGKPAAVEQAVLSLLAQSHSQQAYRDLDPAQIELIQSDESELIRLFGHSMAYYCALDRGDTAQALQAAQALHPLIEDQPVTLKANLQKDLVFAYAQLAKDVDAAERLWHELGPAGQAIKDAPTLLAKAALLQAKGESAAALATIQEGLTLPSAASTKYSDQFLQQQFRQLAESIA